MSAVEDPYQERRITFCLYECWESIAGGVGLPALKNMKRTDLEPFKNNLVLLDLRNGDNQSTFQVIGRGLQEDLGGDLTSKPVKGVPRRTMLSRVTDHYMEVLANRVPITFEAEFVNLDNEKALYRGILLPFSDDNNNINFILGGVRWILAKDLHLEDDIIEELPAGENKTDRVEEELSAVAEENIEAVEVPETENETGAEAENEAAPEKEKKKISVIEKAMQFLSPGFNHDEASRKKSSEEPEPEAIIENEATDGDVMPSDAMEQTIEQSSNDMDVGEAEIDPKKDDEEEDTPDAEEGHIEEKEIEAEEAEKIEGDVVFEINDGQKSLPELRTTLDQIVGYINKEDADHNRSRDSLYNILTVTYGFHETCEHSPDAFREIVKEHDLKIQARAPFTPVLKICLGRDYDKTRLTEYAAALGIARYMNVEASEFHAFIKNFPGGIKGCVKEMRAIRKSGKSDSVAARKTRTIEEAREILRALSPISSFRLKKIVVGRDVNEFCLLLARRRNHTIDIIKILDDKFTKIDPILKRAVFIKDNLNIRK